MRKYLSVAALLMSGLLFMTACGDDDDDAPSVAEPQETEQPSDNSDEPVPTSAAAIAPGTYVTGLQTVQGDESGASMTYTDKIEFAQDGTFTLYRFVNAQGQMMAYRWTGTYTADNGTVTLNMRTYDHTPNYGMEGFEWYPAGEGWQPETVVMQVASRGDTIVVTDEDGTVQTFTPADTVSEKYTVVGKRTFWMTIWGENNETERMERVVFDISATGRMKITIPVWGDEMWEGTYTTDGQNLSFRVSSVTRPNWDPSYQTRDEIDEQELKNHYDFTAPYFFDANGAMYISFVGLFGVFEL